MNARVRQLKGLKALFEDAVEHGSRQVERFHVGLIDVPYSVLERIPVTAVPAKVAHDVHLAITGFLYENVRRSAKVVGAAADVAFALVPEPNDSVIADVPPAPVFPST